MEANFLNADWTATDAEHESWAAKSVAEVEKMTQPGWLENEAKRNVISYEKGMKNARFKLRQEVSAMKDHCLSGGVSKETRDAAKAAAAVAEGLL